MRAGAPALILLIALTAASPCHGQEPASPPSPAAAPPAEPGLLGTPLIPASTATAVDILDAGEHWNGAAEGHVMRRSRRATSAHRITGLCRDWHPEAFQRNPSRSELHCRHRVQGPGRFGLLSYIDLPVYQPATPMPGTHLAGVPGHAQPRPGETFEEWEWRVHRTVYPAHTRVPQRGLELLDPRAASRAMALEKWLTAENIPFQRRETWRSPERQAWLFQQGRSRPGPIATATLTSWHGQLDERGMPAGRAVDYVVSARHMQRFHEIAHALGLDSFGADSNDPGHVFLPHDQKMDSVEIQLLRVLPRVPEVTLSTGLPVDRTLPVGGTAVLRAAVESWLDGPFVPYVVPEITGLRPFARPDLRPFMDELDPDRQAL